VISKDFDILKKKQIPGHVTKWNRPSFFGFDSKTVIGDGFTRFMNLVSVSLVKQAVSPKPKLKLVSVSTNMDHALSLLTDERPDATTHATHATISRPADGRRLSWPELTVACSGPRES